jgi:hypothetical protein
MLNSVAFLFRSEQEARERKRLGGTAFLIGRHIKGSDEVLGQPYYMPYLVSNRHVVFDSSACVASVNRRDGGPPDIWDIDQNSWIAHPTEDLAATPAISLYDRTKHRISFTEESKMLTPDLMAHLDVGVGEEVFMIGRFVNLQGETINLPAARFGSISVGVTDIATRDADGSIRSQESFAVEMRSRTGFSGSPVIVYRTLTTVLTDVPDHAKDFWYLLGVNWGYIPGEDGENTWLNGVIPAWKISEMFELPALSAFQAGAELYMHRNADTLRSQLDAEAGC